MIKEEDIKLVTVTPELAQEYLDRNTANYRRAKKPWLNKYVKAMKEGRWNKDALQVIQFDENGVLLDGQKRLMAMIETQTTLKMLVKDNVPEDVKFYIDIGEVRSKPQHLEAAGFKYRTIDFSSTLNNMVQGKYNRGRGGVDPVQHVKDAERYRDAVMFSLSLFKPNFPVKGLNKAQIRAVFARAYEHYGGQEPYVSRMREFVEIYKGEPEAMKGFEDKDYAAFIFAKWMERMVSAREARDTSAIYAKAEVSLKYFIEGKKTLKIPKDSPKELFPLEGEKGYGDNANIILPCVRPKSVPEDDTPPKPEIPWQQYDYVARAFFQTVTDIEDLEDYADDRVVATKTAISSIARDLGAEAEFAKDTVDKIWSAIVGAEGAEVEDELIQALKDNGANIRSQPTKRGTSVVWVDSLEVRA